MTKKFCIQKLIEIYALFGKKLPDKPIVDALFKVLQGMPETFMDYALERLESEEKMPSNLRFFFVNSLKPGYLAARARQTGNFPDRQAFCGRCNIPGMPGYLRLWDPVQKMARVFRCLCNCNPASGLMAITDEEISRLGLLWSAPRMPSHAWKNAQNFQPQPARPEHLDYLSDMEGGQA